MRIPPISGCVLYDGDCVFCVRWAHFWRPVLRSRGFEIDELQAQWTTEALGMTRDEVVRDIRLITAEGKSYAGADVYLHIARRIWWAWPFGAFFSLPGFRALIWAGYRWFAKNRQCVSGFCVRPGGKIREGQTPW